YLQSQYRIKNIKFADFYDRNSANESIAVRKDWPILAEILRKSLDSLTDAEINAIFTKWSPLPSNEQEPLTVSADTAADTRGQMAEPPASEKKISFYLHSEVPTPIWLMLIVLLLWIFQIRRQSETIEKSRNELRLVNMDLQGLQNNLEQLVIKRTAQLKASEFKFRNLVENQGNEFFFYHLDNNGNFTYLSPSLSNILGYSPDEFKTHFREYLTDNPVNQKLDENIKICTEGVPTKPYQIEIFDVNKKIRWLEVIDSPAYDDYGNCIGVDGVVLDATARKKADEQLIYLSYYDGLTQLANRRLFMDRLQQSINLASRNRSPFALFFLDLVNFTDINDTMGRSAGDEILRETARRLIVTLRNSDIKARFGGDEFALLLPETSKEQAQVVAQKIIKALKEPYLLSGKEMDLNVSIGIAYYPQDGKDCDSLIKQADAAMYHARNKRLEAASSIKT
ncbi:MAG: diguanylate cyclase domain-containing protein, partial [Gammaproteobacteria bacterium]